jgi:hypothetical protein
MKEPPALYAQGLAPLSVPTHRKWERKQSHAHGPSSWYTRCWLT